MRVMILFAVAIAICSVGCATTSAPDTSETTGEARCQTCDPGDDMTIAEDAIIQQFETAYPGEQRTGVTCFGIANGYACSVYFDLNGTQEYRCQVEVYNDGTSHAFSCATCVQHDTGEVCTF